LGSALILVEAYPTWPFQPTAPVSCKLLLDPTSSNRLRHRWAPVRGSAKPAAVVPGPLHKGSVEGKDSVSMERVMLIVGNGSCDLPRDVTNPWSRLSARGERNHRRSVGASPSRVFARQHDDLRAAPTRGKSSQPARSPVDAAPVHKAALVQVSRRLEDEGGDPLDAHLLRTEPSFGMPISQVPTGSPSKRGVSQPIIPSPEVGNRLLGWFLAREFEPPPDQTSTRSGQSQVTTALWV